MLNEDMNNLPIYKSKATQEERQQSLEIMTNQIRVIKKQESDEIPTKFTRIRCVCNNFVIWRYMYRCLYCGIWFCEACAEEHFGAKKP